MGTANNWKEGEDVKIEFRNRTYDGKIIALTRIRHIYVHGSNSRGTATVQYNVRCGHYDIETKEETLDMGDPRLSKAPQSPTTTDNTWTVGEDVKIEVMTYRYRGEVDRPGDAPSGPVMCPCTYDGKITAVGFDFSDVTSTSVSLSPPRTATVEYKLPSGEKKEETLRMDGRRLSKFSPSEKQQAQSSEPGFFSQMGQHVSNGYSGAKNTLSRWGDNIGK